MSIRIPRSWLNGPIDVEDALPEGPVGERFAPPRRIQRAMTKDGRRMVRNPEGDQVPSNSQVLIDPEHLIPTNSMVTVWPGTPHQRRAKLVAVERMVAKGQMSHQVLYLE